MKRQMQARQSSVVTRRHAGGRTPRSTGLRLSVVRSASEFSALRPIWDDLVHSVQVSIYQTFEWQRTWWKYFGEKDPLASLYIIVLRDGDTPVGVAPFFVRTVSLQGIASVRRLSFIGTGLSDYLNIIVRDGFEFAAVETLVQHLCQERRMWDVVHLEDIPATSISHKLLFSHLAKNGWSGERLIINRCPRTQLKNSWRGTLAQLSGSQRRSIVTQRRRMERAFEVEFEVVRKRDSLRERLKEFIALHQERWIQHGQRGVCSSPGVTKFLEEAAWKFFDRGWLSLTFLRVDGMRVAASLGFQYGNSYLGYLAGVSAREDTQKYSPGQVLIGFCMEEAVEGGRQVFDFLRGAEPYKYHFGATDVPNIGLIMYPNGSGLNRWKYGFIQLFRALEKRWEREWSLLRHQRRTSGFFSIQFLSHIIRRLHSVSVDGTKKVRSPHSAVYVGDDSEEIDRWIQMSD